MKTSILTAMLVFGSANLWAAAPAIQGQSSLKLGGETAIRDTREAIAEIDREIAALEREIKGASAQSTAYRIIPSNGGTMAAQMDTVATEAASRKDQMLRERAELQESLRALAE